MNKIYEVKQMLEARGTCYGIYKSGKLWESGFLTKEAAERLASMMNAKCNSTNPRVAAYFSN